VKPNFRSLGRRFGKGTPAVAAAITAADAASLAADMRTAGETSVVVDGERVPLGADDVIITQTPRPAGRWPPTPGDRRIGDPDHWRAAAGRLAGR
jgi:hypothetical protein